ncbi:KAP-like P-loop domain-containing protein [Edaphobacter aggregans]|uniref:KAP-like P-loop domain-containing protein n=1 Tax=Edaphobacter aggregans TaxID=570835 RepID=A0A428MLJ3_9BACT|nr:P-loop NTPase fold protein [Edaphobacter aggregans]RSL17699.1 KAP-like P-loop domain-containing protein [Edaphobacter aggregans]
MLLLLTTPIALIQRYGPVPLKALHLTRLNVTQDHWWLRPLFLPPDSELPYIASPILAVAHNETSLWIGGQSGFLATMDDHIDGHPGPWKCLNPASRDDRSWSAGGCTVEQLQTSQSIATALRSFSPVPSVYAATEQSANANPAGVANRQSNAPPQPNTASPVKPGARIPPAPSISDKTRSVLPQPQTPSNANLLAPPSGNSSGLIQPVPITTNAELLSALNIKPQEVRTAVDESKQHPNVLALEWFSDTEAAMLTDSAILYRTFDHGLTWNPYPISLIAKPDQLKLVLNSPVNLDNSALQFVLAGQTFRYDLDKRAVASSGNTTSCEETINKITSAYDKIGFLKPSPQCVIRPNPLRAWSTLNPKGKSSLWLLTADNRSGQRLVRSEPSGLGGLSLRLPPPWYLFVALPLAGLLLYLAAMRSPAQPPTDATIANLAVSDRPLEWNDADVMDFHSIARGLSLFLRNKNTGVPLVLAINGPWGSGKSSLMNLLAARMKDVSNTITFNAWHHQSEDQLLAALLQAVRTQGLQSVWSPRGVWRRLRLILIKNSEALPAATFAIFALLGSGSIVVITTWYFLNHVLSNPATSLELRLLSEGKYVFAALVAFLGILKTVKIAVGSVIANPSSLLVSGSGSGSLKDLDAQTTFRQRFAGDFRNLTKLLKRRRIVIIIDDLDRCRPEKIREVMEAVNFLVSSGECFVVLGLARRNIEYYLGESFRSLVQRMPDDLLGKPDGEEKGVAQNDKSLRFAHSYLDKLIQIDVPVPLITGEQAREMVASAESVATLTEEELRIRYQVQLHSGRVAGTRDFLLWARKWSVPILASILLTLTLSRSIIRWDTALLNRLNSIPATKSSAAPEAGVASGPSQSTQTQSPNPGSPIPVGSETSQAPLNPATPAPNSQPNAAGAQNQVSGTATYRTVPSITTAHSLPWWLTYPFIGLLLLIFLAILLRLAFEDKETLEIDDKENFKRALYEWAPFIYLNFQSPRALKRYLNKVRFIASRQRGLNEADGIPRIKSFSEFLVKRWERIWDKATYEVVLAKASEKTADMQSIEIPDRVLVILVALECNSRTWNLLNQNSGSTNMPEAFLTGMEEETRAWWQAAPQESLLSAIRTIWPELVGHLNDYRELTGKEARTPLNSDWGT